MVNEANSDEYEDQEEGEYHFSDDDAEYELEQPAEAQPVKAKPAVDSSPNNMIAKIGQYRRVIIGAVVFIVLLYIVYKMVVPSTPAPTTEFDAAANKPAVTAAPPAAPVQQPAPQAQPALSTPPPAAAPAQSPQPAAAPAMALSALMAPPASQQMAQPPAAMLPAQEPVEAPAPGAAAQMSQAATAASVADRVAMLEQQNAKLMSLVGTDYGQKSPDSEAQNAALQAKVRELNTRLANMEATLSQITRMLLNNNSSGAMPSAGSSVPATIMRGSTEPKMVYTVQAIIPGRAWLKSDNGDTVTVAEGDVLKAYGRVTKIDPYDGVVDIDTGGRTISLSYGTSGE